MTEVLMQRSPELESIIMLRQFCLKESKIFQTIVTFVSISIIHCA